MCSGVSSYSPNSFGKPAFGCAPEVAGAESAIEPDEERLCVTHGVPERLGRLPGQRSAGGVRDRAGNHDRQLEAAGREGLPDREYRRLGIQRVEDGLDQQEIHASFDQRRRRFPVRCCEVGKRDVAKSRVVHVGRNGRGPVGRAQHTGHEPGRTHARRMRIRRLARKPRSGEVEFADERLHPVIAHRGCIGVEGVGLDDVGAGREKLPVDVLYDFGPRDRKQIIIALDVPFPIAKARAAIIVLAKPAGLDHRTHRAVQQHDALLEEAFQCNQSLFACHGEPFTVHAAACCGRTPSA
jgi:hypothetical protein